MKISLRLYCLVSKLYYIFYGINTIYVYFARIYRFWNFKYIP